MATPENNDNEIRIVLLGKTGTGKSFLGNNLLGDKMFESKAGASSTTTRCQTGCRHLEDGKKMVIVDTPELHDNTKSSDEIRQYIAPGVHAFIIVLRIGRFTKEELETIKKLQSLFGEHVTKHAFVVFTEKDKLYANNQTLDAYVKDLPGNLTNMLSQCGWRYVAVNNLAEGEDLQADIEGVMNLIRKMAANAGESYTAEMFAAAAEKRGTKGTSKKTIPDTLHSGPMETPDSNIKQLKIEEDETKDVSAKEITTVLLGRIGAGKSSLGNNLLGEKKFKTKVSPASVTTECQKGSVILPDGKTLTIVDTPGMYDTGRYEGKSADECCRCIGVSAPKVHVFIIVLHIGGFHGEELKTIKEVQTLLGDRVSRHTCIVFTDKPSLDAVDQTLEEFIKDSPENLKSMLKECGSRFVAVDNLNTEGNLKNDMESVIRLINQTMEKNRGETFNVAETVSTRMKGPGGPTNYPREPGGPVNQSTTGLEGDPQIGETQDKQLPGKKGKSGISQCIHYFNKKLPVKMQLLDK